MAFEGARLIKKEEKANASLHHLKPREISMLFALLIVAIAALTVYFVLLPMLTNQGALAKELEGLQAQETEYRLQIAQTESFKQMYDDAQTDYYKYISYFYGPMVPEIIDERITSMLIAHGLSPTALSMSNLVAEGVPVYFAEELRANPVPVPVDIGEGIGTPLAGNTGAAGGGADAGALADAADGGGGGGGSGGGSDGGAGGAPQGSYDCYAFVYTVKATASGGREDLYAFLAKAQSMTALKVTSFDYKDPSPETASDNGGQDAEAQGVINLEIKLYAFVEGVMASDQAGSR